MRILTIFSLFFVAGLLACAASTQSNGKSAVHNRDYLSLEEIKSTSAINAYDLIQKARPHWLRGRGARSLKFQETTYPLVYVNESRLGEINTLSSISVESIKEVQFLNPGDATNKFGINHPSGAILITTL